MERSHNKSMFLHHLRNICEHLAKEAWLRRELAVQLAAAHQRITELTLATEEVANL
jgi:hypothetical protein